MLIAATVAVLAVVLLKQWFGWHLVVALAALYAPMFVYAVVRDFGRDREWWA